MLGTQSGLRGITWQSSETLNVLIYQLIVATFRTEKKSSACPRRVGAFQAVAYYSFILIIYPGFVLSLRLYMLVSGPKALAEFGR